MLRHFHYKMDDMFYNLSLMMHDRGLVPHEMPPPPLCFAASSFAAVATSTLFQSDPSGVDSDMTKESDAK